jgi:rhodanese-related sulfurtransferase
MKRSLLIALSVLLLCGGAYAQEAKPLKEHEIEQIALKVAREAVQGGYQLLSASELKGMVDAKEEFILVDAHPPKDFAQAYIAGAANFGFAGIRTGKWEDDALGKSLESYKALLGSDLNRKVVVYCGFNVCGRSHNAAMWARELGYRNVYRMPGGTRAWKDAGYAYQTAD